MGLAVSLAFTAKSVRDIGKAPVVFNYFFHNLSRKLITVCCNQCKYFYNLFITIYL